MKKRTFILSTLTLLSFSSLAQAKQNICVFDLLGKAGESYKLIEEWAKAAGNLNLDQILRLKEFKQLGFSLEESKKKMDINT